MGSIQTLNCCEHVPDFSVCTLRAVDDGPMPTTVLAATETE